MYAYVKKEHSWFGGAMSIEKNSGFLTVTRKIGIKGCYDLNIYIYNICFLKKEFNILVSKMLVIQMSKSIENRFWKMSAVNFQ